LRDDRPGFGRDDLAPVDVRARRDPRRRQQHFDRLAQRDRPRAAQRATG
jgi:hypothetical protein